MKIAFPRLVTVNSPLRRLSRGLAGLALTLLPLIGEAAFVDPLDQPAAIMAAIEKQPLRDIVNTGQRLVAVGDNGLVILSDDQGANWRQANVPVSVDLNAVHFSTADAGWAVGHGAVILHSGDGGETWVKQLDGRGLERITVDYFEGPQSGLSPDRAKSYLSAILDMTRPGPGQFFMGVWFDAEGRQGYAIGPFGLILGSADGGRSWQPWNTHIDNNDLLHLTGIREVGERLFLSGERGRVWRLDPAAQRFEAHETGYEGTLFGLTGNRQVLLAYGLRGNVFRSTDAGVSWVAVANELGAGVTDGAMLDGERVVLVSQAAQVVFSDDHGRSFTPLRIPHPTLFTGVVGLSESRLAVVGLSGVTTLSAR